MNYRNCRNYENIEKGIYPGVGKYEIPVIKPAQFEIPKHFVDFNAAKSMKEGSGKGIHFFIDDYRFNRLWTSPGSYVEVLSRFECMMSPDFSTYTDFPVAIQIFNHYRKHWIAAYMQEYGIRVIPTISWGTPDSFRWCFDGEPAHSIVAVSSVGTQQNRHTKRLFIEGYREMVRQLEPETIIFYGSIPEECKGNIVRVKTFQEKFREAKCNGW